MRHLLVHFSQAREGVVGLSGNAMVTGKWHMRTTNLWSKLITP